MEENKNLKLKIEELSDSEFLSFLYSEREREESLNTYQGWNIWAISGALITVLCAGYRLFSQHSSEIDFLRVGYVLSGVMAFLLCYRPYARIVAQFFSRKRSIDYLRIRTLKEVVPIAYVFLSLLCSITFSIFIPIVDKVQPWNDVTFLWMASFLSFLGVIICIIANKDKIVKSYLGELLFPDVRKEIVFSSVMSVVFSVIWLHSFKRVEGRVLGSFDFEIAVCIAAALLLFYLIIKVLNGEKSSSNIDLLLDDLIYKGRTRESVFQQLLIHRMGYNVLEVCAQELFLIKQSFDAFDKKKEKLELVNEQMLKGTFNINRISEYVSMIQEGSKFIEDCDNQINALDEKLSQVVSQVPELGGQDEYKKLLLLEKALYEKEKEMLEIVRPTVNSLQMWVEVYQCKKYGGWCVRECPHRNEQQSFGYRFVLFVMKFFPWLISTNKRIKNCKEENKRQH